MRVNNPDYLSFGGKPITGRIPPTMVVDGGVLTQEQYGGVIHAYKLFCDMTKLAIGDYQVANRILKDGTRVRMISINKADTVLVWPTGGGSQETWYRGICAYHAGYTSGTDFTPKGMAQVTVFKAVDVPSTPWKVLKTNPKQAPTPAKPPLHMPVRAQYWVTTGGNVWLNYNGKTNHLSIAEKGNGDHATKASIGSVPVVARSGVSPGYDLPAAAYGPIPFKFDDTKYLATSTGVASRTGAILIEFTPRTAPVPAIDPDDAIPARNPTQLPPAISTDGSAIGLQAYDAAYFRVNPYGYSTDLKSYWWTVISGVSSGAVVEAQARALSYHKDVVSSLTSGAYLPIDDSTERMKWYFVYPRNGAWVVYQIISYNWNTYLNQTLGDFGDVVSSEQSETSFSSQQKDYFNFPLTVSSSDSSVIGYIPSGLALAPVLLTVQCSVSRELHAEGQFYYGVQDVSAALAAHSDIASEYARVGEGTKRYVRTAIDTDELNISYIEVSVGGEAIRTFEVHQSTTGRAEKKTIARTAINAGVNWDGMAGPNDYHRISTDYHLGFFRDDNWESYPFSPSHLMGSIYAESGNVYETGLVGHYTAHFSKPTVWETYSPLAAVTDEAEDSDYITDMAMDIASRTILAFDLQIGFVAYLELKVVNNLKIIAPKEHDWVYDLHGVGVPLKEFPNTVTAKFICVYQGVSHEQTLFSVTVSKPPVRTSNITTNWHKWDGGDTFYDGEQELISSRIWLPTTETFTGIDGVFQHQGVCQDLAGFTQDEASDPVKAGYPEGTDLNRMIYSKRFNINTMADSPVWLMTYTEINSMKEEAKYMLDPPPELIVPYYYSPELREKLLETTYEVQFDHSGLRAWISDIPATTSYAEHDSAAFRI